jgi:pSer/pThr/pTyr-binding forkhead associated (FHA) protein
MFGFGTVACLAGLVFALWIKRRRTPVAGTPEARSGDRVAPIVQLRGTTGDFRGRVISVGPAVLAIGRDPASCDLVIRDATRYVSRRHCRVSIEPGGHYLLVEDCGSTNGTFVGHVRLRPNDPRLIVPGERFRVGGPENEFEVAHPESPACLPARS